ncbi:hypothetical protein LXL04_027657 [Taraxacum kok-saghyz]
MALTGKRVAKVKIESDSHLFLELWKSKQHEVSSMSPTTYRNCQRHEDTVETVGCLHSWNYCLDGKESFAKTIIIDEDENSITYKILEGDLMELYKTFVVNIHVETQGSQNLVTWTIEYEKLNSTVPDPNTVVDFYTKATKDIETHHLQK